MPNYKGHLLGGLITFICVSNIKYIHQQFLTTKPALWPLLGISCLLGSLAPDIDIHSNGRKIWDIGIFFGILISSLFKTTRTIVLLLGMFLFARIVGHRNLTHNPLFIIVIPYCLTIVLSKHFPVLKEIYSLPFYISFTAGALSHIALDFVPKRFIPKIFFSIDNKKYPYRKK